MASGNDAYRSSQSQEGEEGICQEKLSVIRCKDVRAKLIHEGQLHDIFILYVNLLFINTLCS